MLSPPKKRKEKDLFIVGLGEEFEPDKLASREKYIKTKISMNLYLDNAQVPRLQSHVLSELRRIHQKQKLS
jgi:hypothetical protein